VGRVSEDSHAFVLFKHQIHIKKSASSSGVGDAQFLLAMRIKHLCTLGLRFAALSFLAVLLPMGCNAKNPKKVKVKKAAKIEIVDSTARKALGDSAYSVLMSGKIKSMLVSADAKCSEMKYLAREDCHLLRFLLADPNLYLGTIPFNGKFIPCVSFEFQKTSEEVVFINLDFGLKEWTLTSKSGKELYRSALSTSDLLRFCHELYPNNEFIKNHYYSTKK